MDLDRFVPGIYNYCDRWCERCPVTAKCFLYWQEQRAEVEHLAAGRDPHDWAVVLDDVRQRFDHVIHLLREAAGEHGENLDSLPPADDARPDPSSHPLQRRAETYTVAAHAFVTDLRRRVMREHEVLEGREFHRRDALGSARVAHDGVVRSLAALQAAYNWDRGLEDQVLPLLADLDRMRQQIEETFPGCQNFKRPGLDPDQNQPRGWWPVISLDTRSRRPIFLNRRSSRPTP